MPQPRRILVFLPNWVGDVVMATPALRALRRACHDGEIVYFGRVNSIALLVGCGWYDKLLLDQSKKRPRWWYFLRTAKRLRQMEPDLAILLTNSFRTALLARWAKIPNRLGYARDGRGWLLTDRLDPPRGEKGGFLPEPMIDYYARLVERVGASVDERRMELPRLDADESKTEALLKNAGRDAARPLVVLNPGASFGPSKMYPPDRFAVVADLLIARFDAQIVINAAPSDAERDIALAVEADMHSPPLLNFASANNTLGQLKCLLARSDLLITNDTGPRHIAAAMGIGVVTLFGSTDPVWAQIDYDRERIIRSDVPCSPCQKKICPLPAGPQHHQCMTSIEPEDVASAAADLLGRERER